MTPKEHTDHYIMNGMRYISIALSLYIIMGAAHAHFSLGPKIEILPREMKSPDKLLVRDGKAEASRGDFSAFLQRLTAFDTKYQRQQPSFSAHFNLLQGIAFFHPDNVHKYIDSLNQVEGEQAIYQLGTRSWFNHQAEIYSRLIQRLQRARRSGLARSPAVRPVLDLYAAGAKTALLEEMITLGPMEPTVAGMKAFARTKPDDYTKLLETGPPEDTKLTPGDEQKRLRERWLNFRKALMSITPHKNHCDAIRSLSVPDETLMIEVNDRKITKGELLAIFGKPPNDRRWNGLKKGNCSRLTLFYVMADFVDRLGILPERVASDIRISSDIYLMAAQLASEIPAGLSGEREATPTLLTVRNLMQYPKVVKVKDWVMRKPDGEEIQKGVYIDQEFIRTTEWSIKRVLAPKHAIHQ